MILCPEHGKPLTEYYNGCFGSRLNQHPTKGVECREPGCKALSGPTCYQCLPYVHVNLHPCAAPKGEKQWGPEPVRYFKCLVCGDHTWRFQSEVEHYKAWEKWAVERLAPYYKTA